MGKFLILDIGAGTMDVLYYDSSAQRHYKAVVMSPVLFVAKKIENLPGNLLISGNEMGGGAVSEVLKRRAKECEVIMSTSSATTVHHDPEKVRSMGIKLAKDERIEELRKDKKYTYIRIGDLEFERLWHIIAGMGVPFSFDVVGICAQDHGIPPRGMSHLDYRQSIFKGILDKAPFPHQLLYKSDEIPKTLNRLTSIADDAKSISANEVFVMDSGMAAILGASMDPIASNKERQLILDIATSHTVGAAMERGEIAGFFEYHTRDITRERLESLLVELADGELEHATILREGGHGAYIRNAIGFRSIEIIVATGPKRSLINGSIMPIKFGGPLGDNMMTGTIGVLEAIRRKKGLESFSYRQ